jgi:hypothetical protein
MNIIKAKSDEKNWNIDLGGLARIWKVRGHTHITFVIATWQAPRVDGG